MINIKLINQSALIYDGMKGCHFTYFFFFQFLLYVGYAAKDLDWKIVKETKRLSLDLGDKRTDKHTVTKTNSRLF